MPRSWQQSSPSLLGSNPHDAVPRASCPALFRRFAITHQPVFDRLSACSYGMYLIHYPVVVWLQFALLAVALDPIAKGAIVYVGAVALNWGIVAALRRVPVIARVL